MKKRATTRFPTHMRGARSSLDEEPPYVVEKTSMHVQFFEAFAHLTWRWTLFIE